MPVSYYKSNISTSNISKTFLHYYYAKFIKGIHVLKGNIQIWKKYTIGFNQL